MTLYRDPSDGTVKERPKPSVSGLPELENKESREEAERLEWSRDWLKRRSIQSPTEQDEAYRDHEK